MTHIPSVSSQAAAQLSITKHKAISQVSKYKSTCYNRQGIATAVVLSLMLRGQLPINYEILPIIMTLFVPLFINNVNTRQFVQF